jgi:hypothetical protein
MSDDVQHTKLDRLLSRYLEGGLSREEMAALEEIILSDDRFADQFSRWCLLHRQIAELLSEDQLHELMDQFVTGSPGPPKNMFSPLARADQHRSGRSGTRNAGMWSRGNAAWIRPVRDILAVSLLFVGIASIIFVLTRGRDQGRPLAENDPRPTVAAEAAANDRGTDAIATLTQLVDPVWRAETPRLRNGTQLLPGSRVALESGVAKVVFDCGAEVMLEGPCDFEAQSRMVGRLDSGRITADVPRRAFAFAILCPGVDFVDMGTSFGVAVGSNGRTELHVFEGEVLCSQPRHENRPRNDITHVKAKSAVEFHSGGDNPSDIAMNAGQFSGLIAHRRPTGEPSQRLLRDRLALWLSADVAVATDDRGRVVTWPDIIYGDNLSAEDAVQGDEEARPKLVRDALNGHAAVRFDGKSDFLLTTPLETTDDQTVLLVCQYSKTAYDKDRIWGGQILNYDGPPSRYLSDTLEPGVLQIGEPLLEEEFKPTLLTGQVFAGFIGSATVEAGRVDATQVGADVPIIVSYVYDFGNGRAELRINGHLHGEGRAFAPQGITSRKIIGRHAWMQNFFHGDLAELLIYNKALSPQELAETTAYLAERYAITLDVIAAAPDTAVK